MEAIVIEDLTRSFGDIHAVQDLTFSVSTGRITGFLGPNGAGKTTTLRILLGLSRPTAGTATFGGVRYEDLRAPARTVGAVLEATSFHPGRRARDHLRILATASGIPSRRVDEVLGIVGLETAAHRRVGGFSLGMRQRLGLAAALLGDPQTLVLDEPTNGLDPEGVRWLRDLLREFARDGRSVLVSSHLLAEVAQTVDEVVVIARGRLVAHAPLDEILHMRSGAGAGVMVRTPDGPALLDVLAARGFDASSAPDDRIVIRGASPEEVGVAIASSGAVVYEMQAIEHNLEEIFLGLTSDRSEP